ncbi:MAG: cytochrome c [Deltaproteobacteria bacterium]|nr:cytochrome c [Deltaproteobacteria bacterium]
MHPTSKLIAALLLLALPAVGGAAASQVLSGDATRGAALFRLHCAACHGPDGRGGGPLAPQLGAPTSTNLRDVAFLMQRSDDDLHRAIAQGGRSVNAAFTMPGFAGDMAPLDVWDLVAFVRQGQPSVGEFFPSAARFTAKAYSFDADSQKRLEAALGALAPEETRIVLVTAFGGTKVAGDEPVYVPHDPRLLDGLKPKQKLGYLGFATVTLAAGSSAIPVSLALDKDGALLAVRPRPESIAEKDLGQLVKLLAGFVGQGSKRSPYQELKPSAPVITKGKKPAKKAEDSKEMVEAAKALSRAYLRTVEAAVQFDKEERERHWAD